MKNLHVYTAKCPPHDVCVCVFNSWHIAQNKATTKNRENLNTYVMCWCSQNWNGMQNMAYINWLWVYSTHSHTSRNHEVRFDVHRNVQITANTELLLYIILFFESQNLLSVGFSFCFFLHLVFVACNVATWTAYFIYILFMVIWWKIHLHPTIRRPLEKNVTWQLWPNVVWRWSGPFKHMHILYCFLLASKSQKQKQKKANFNENWKKKQIQETKFMRYENWE